MVLPAIFQRAGGVASRAARFSAAPLAIGAIVVALLIGGCASSAPPRADDATIQQRWEKHRDTLAQLARWQLTGRVAVRTADDGWNASIHWVQEGDDGYAIEFSGPFGQGVAAVRAAGGVVTIELPDRPIAAAADAETLLAHELGWTVPVSALRYWILGMPAPDVAADTELDNNGLLVALSQSGWRAEFHRYKPVDGIPLPAKVTLTRDEVRLRFVIDTWRAIAADPGEPHVPG